MLLSVKFVVVDFVMSRAILAMVSCTRREPRCTPHPRRLAFLVIGTVVASLCARPPARAAARQAPARSMKGGDVDHAAVAATSGYAGVALLAIGAMLARLPSVGGLPLFGYAAIAALLFGAVLLVPVLTVRILLIAPRINRVVPDTALAQLRENVGLSTLSLASIIVSFSLMVAMAIMVYSFRVSFDQWLGRRSGRSADANCWQRHRDWPS